MRQGYFQAGAAALVCAALLCAQAALAAQPGSPNFRAAVEQPVEQPVATQSPDKPQKKAKGPAKNRDTARNRQDYVAGTGETEGADGITAGRDEKTGESVMGFTPPKKKPQRQPFEDQPIQVRPIVPVVRPGP